MFPRNKRSSSYRSAKATLKPPHPDVHFPEHRGRDKLASHHKFDDTTGQVYSETTAGMQSGDDREWASSGDLTVKQRGKGPPGSRSLQEASIECILQNIQHITLEGIECLPEHIVRRVWDAVSKRCTCCFTTWNIFSKVLRGCEPIVIDLLTYHQKIPYPRSSLNTYATALKSGSFDYITSLNIYSTFPTQELLKLSCLTNLGVLQISGFTQGVNDHLIRAWQHSAINEGAFRVLRILKLWGHEGLTNDSFQFIHAFPCLAVFDVMGPRFHLDSNVQRQARENGWHIRMHSKLTEALNEFCQKEATAMADAEHKAFLESTITPVKGEGSLVGIEIPGTGNVTPVSRYAVMSLLKEKKTIGVHQKTGKSHINQSWDLIAFSRVGELRDNADMKSAGVLVEKQLIVGNALISSIPTVSLSLGHYAESAAQYAKTSLKFIRPVVVNANTKDYKTAVRSSSSRARESTSTGTTMRSNKRRKVDDVLNSFY